MNQHNRIFIVGHPGTGKALFAKTLAEKLGWQFINTDLELEFRVGRTLPEIVGKQGEKEFLDCESEILLSQLNKENIVVNTDASVVLSKKIIQHLSSEFVVYLGVSTPAQIERTVCNPDQLLPVASINEFLDKLHHERNSRYEKMATVSIDTGDGKLDEHVKSIAKIFLENKTSNQLTLNKNDMVVFHKTLHTPVNLTEQQAKCLKLLAQGKSSKEIAKDMNISYRTVEGCIAKTMDLLGCSSSKELIALYHDKP